jgi:glycosyltransferase involved in cell wall biosynthesis
MSAHDMLLPEQFAGATGTIKRRLLGAMLGRIDRVHAVSRDNAANLLAQLPSLRAERVTTIVHGIDVARFRDASAAPLREALGLPGETRVVGFFGRFMSPKGFRTLVRAVERIAREGRLGREELRIVTFGWGGFIREDYAWLQELGLEDLFVQHPHTDAPERYLKACDVVAMPSRWEACGLLAMEALVAGVPIVGTDCIGLREVLAGSPARIVAVGDDAGLAAALESELAQPRREAFAAWQRTAAERFDLDRASTDLARTMESLAR